MPRFGCCASAATASNCLSSITSRRPASAARWRRRHRRCGRANGHALVRQRLREGGFDLLHVQNFFPRFSPAVYYAAAAEGVPVIQAIRNYRLVCASANLFRDGRPCEDCVGRLPIPALVHGCYRDSRLASASVAAMQVTHRAMGTWRQKVDRYVALTDYVKGRLVAGGFPGDRIIVKPNFVPDLAPDGEGAPEPGSFALYVGRLTSEKGVDWLVRQWAEAGIELPLKIVGEGPVAEAAGGPANVEFLGRLPAARVYGMMRAARFVVVPGQWPEPFGRVVVESFSVSTPVIAAAAGGLTELIRHDETGLLFPPGDADAFVEQVRALAANPDRAAAMGATARQSYLDRYTPAANYEQISAIYQDVLAARRVTPAR
jgi:glycosyltransferase involved in cell wall biosynthesis